MGAVIRGCSVARPVQMVRRHGARRLADDAVASCLREARLDAGELDLLVNAGVYRERGLGEPALAALVQDDVHANRTLNGHGHGTFSFDIDNGMCGVLTAVDIVRGFLLSGAVETTVVVASDSGPGPVHARSLPRKESGGALLLTRDDTTPGFSAVDLTTYPEYAGLFEGFWTWRDRRLSLPHRAAGANRLVVRQRDGFIRQSVRCATESVTGFLARENVAPDEIDLLIGVPGPEFCDGLADGLGIPHTRALHAGEQIAAMHSAQPIAAIHHARRSGRWQQAHTILLVCAGSGITVASALYRQ